jgi:SOS-response transcriptional repressor LexA
VVGQCAAGRGVEFLPIVQFRDVRLPTWARAADRFVLANVCGNSLSGKGIYDGDFALVHLTKNVQQGDLVVACCHGSEIVIKFFHVEMSGRVCLSSANKKFEPRYFESDEVEVQGRVVRIERDF